MYHTKPLDDAGWLWPNKLSQIEKIYLITLIGIDMTDYKLTIRLGKSDRDRRILELIKTMQAQGMNASEAVKAVLGEHLESEVGRRAYLVQSMTYKPHGK